MPIATVLQRPYYYSFSKNELTWRFDIPLPAAAGCKLQFKLFANTASNIPATQRVFETELRPNSDGFLNVAVQDIVDSMIDYKVPVVTAANRFVGAAEGRQILQAWLDTPFAGGRHTRREEKIERTTHSHGENG